ncbi:Uncharacterised protein [Yersinia pseudotuberculosis]|nr:Uncharacterised protein [Yersinia pseudotuberculosis]
MKSFKLIIFFLFYYLVFLDIQVNADILFLYGEMI